MNDNYSVTIAFQGPSKEPVRKNISFAVKLYLSARAVET